MLLKIKIPNNNTKERNYILDILVGEFLNLPFTIESNNELKEWIIELENQKQIIFKDSFFSKFQEKLSYLKEKNIPSEIEYTKNRFIKQKDIPIIFGDNSLIIEKDKIICGIDIFASSFFMLSRWEEYVNNKKDEHNRYCHKESLAYKNNFLHRAVVNEYSDMLEKMLTYSGLEQTEKKKTNLYLTHDIDHLIFKRNDYIFIKSILGDILKRKTLKKAINRIKNYHKIIQKSKISDPFDTFDVLMDIGEKAGVKSRFYFMSGGNSKLDNYYNIKEQQSIKVIKKIQKRGHIIGFHPSYNTYKDKDMFLKEKQILEDTIRMEVKEGRQHYLKFEVPHTWQIWEDNKMVVDSTLGFSKKEGFRCGTGNDFSVFNILTRKKLKLKERPLILMDVTTFIFNQYHDEEIINKINKLKEYGNITILWHNSSFEHIEIYKSLVNKLKA